MSMPTRRAFLGTTMAMAAATVIDPTTVLSARAPKKVLVLGGTGFIGPHQVRSLLARGHAVTLFNRGKSGAGMFGKDVEELVGDRASNLDALKGRTWDAVIDESASNGATASDWVKATTTLLKDAVDHYLFVSTRSVYADVSLVPMSAAAPVLTLENSPLKPGEPMSYGLGKAYAEKEAHKAMPGRVTVVRPGLIIGPGDDTDRFTYWPVRIARGGEILAPGDGSDPIQIIDVRDLTNFETTLIENKTVGVFNAVGPMPGRTFRSFLEGSQKKIGGSGTFIWVATDFLLANKVRPYADLPVWQIGSGRTAGFNRFDLAPEIKAGLKHRTLEDSAVDTLDWFRKQSQNGSLKVKAGMSPEREAELLALWKARR
jgi:2'-hydroxyisoflavone reductase